MSYKTKYVLLVIGWTLLCGGVFAAGMAFKIVAFADACLMVWVLGMVGLGYRRRKEAVREKMLGHPNASS